jgi:hypothetical protein
MGRRCFNPDADAALDPDGLCHGLFERRACAQAPLLLGVCRRVREAERWRCGALHQPVPVRGASGVSVHRLRGHFAGAESHLGRELHRAHARPRLYLVQHRGGNRDHGGRADCRSAARWLSLHTAACGRDSPQWQPSQLCPALPHCRGDWPGGHALLLACPAALQAHARGRRSRAAAAQPPGAGLQAGARAAQA